MNQTTFGVVVKERRKALGLTQAELARRVGCATVTIRRIEYDTLRPSVQIAERLALALSIAEAEQIAFVRLARTEPPASPLPTPPPAPEEIGQDDLTGRAVRGFELSERLGTGGFGIVYRAKQPDIDREVAIKLILPRHADHPDFIRRFEAEAQLVARLEYPHIVPLYDYWREPGSAYLVMRLLRGGSLEDRLVDGPVPLDTLLPMLNQVGTALHAAHRAGVIHRDLKPANILLDEDHNAYLSDFGIAKDIISHHTEQGAVVGSPAYFSPEQIQAEPVKPQSDIYCLGIMLFELLTGHKPFPGPTAVAYVKQHLGESLPPLATYCPNLPPALDSVLARATAKKPANRYPDVPALLVDFQQAVGGTAGALSNVGSRVQVELADLTNPYKGLRAFGEADADDFFGRDTLGQALLTRLSAEDDLARFLAVVGPSGSGKSSIVQAGLLPALRRGGLPGSEQWFITTMLPGAHPWEELEAALLRVAVNPPDSLQTQLRQDERGLLRAANRILPSDPAVELVLVIDQFEELFTLVDDPAVRAHFLDSLVAAILDERSRLRVIITLRADFFDHPLRFVDFGDILRQRAEFVLPLSPEELEETITQPAAKHGLALESGLATDIARDVGDQPGALPLLQYALTELYERRDGRLLTRAAYQASGGVTGALARRAEEIYALLDNAGQETARQLFLRLVTPGEGTEDTRRRVLLSELESIRTAEVSNEVIGQFGHYRLLTFDRDPASRTPTVEVAHEALLREWTRLNQWLAASRDDLRLQRQLAFAAEAWDEAKKDSSYLLHGTRLAQFEEWVAQTNLVQTTAELEFLQASLLERDRQQAAEATRQANELVLQQRATNRLRWLVVGLTIFLLVAAGLATFALSRQAQAQTNFIRAEAQRLAAEANTLVQAGGNAEVIALLALKSLATQYSPQGDAALQAAAGLDFPQRILTGHQGSLWAVEFSPDGTLAVTGSADGTARLWNAASGEVVQEFVGHEDEVISVAYAPNGQTVLTGSFDQTARLWDVQTGQELHQFVGPDASEVSVTFSPDGQYALTGAGVGGMAYLWRVKDGERVQTFSPPNGEVIDAVISPDGQLAAVSAGESVYLWEIESGDLLKTFAGHTDLILTVAFSPDGHLLASGGYDTVVRLWDVGTGKVRQTFEGHVDGIEKVRFSPDGKTLLTVSDDSSARLWNVETGQEIRQLVGHTGPVIGAAFAPDGHSMATASFDRTAKLWDFQPQPEWPLVEGLWPGAFGGAIDVSPDGRLGAGASETGLRLWDLETGQVRQQFEFGPPILSTGFSPDGEQVWGGAANGSLVGWETKTGQPVHTFTGHQAEIIRVVISPDGHSALTAGASDGTARLWDLEGGEPAHVFRPEAGFVMDVAFSPDGRHALASTASGIAFMWAVEDGELVRQFELDAPAGMPSLAVSPDGARLVAGSRSGDIVLFETGSGQQQQVFSGHTNVVRDLAFSADGTRLLSASADGTARLWDIATGTELRRYNRRPFTVHSAAITPDDRTVLIAGTEGLALRFDVDYRETILYLCGRLQRNFLVEEKTRYDIDPDIASCQ
jgi:WD40 repeat protein/transcriptional regulator with XRE-family HTH domain